MNYPLVVGADVDENGLIHLDLPRQQYQATVRARFAGKRVDIEVRERKSRRSVDQNAWMHAAFTRWVREALPDYQTPSVKDGVERLKDELLALVFGYHVYQSPLTGEVVKGLLRPNTSGLSTKEFSEFMDVSVMEAAKTGHIIELPDEFKARKARAQGSRVGRPAEHGGVKGR